ncbi:hypothetical protein H632_c2791p1 [Helicosporidium sp. ATCC 50920]|nr:hypothetical protein H632_c2791p1 [Helicosporidium sp. ATCC 50920]|eukprot:KDD72873.1 hypothetical protein H632_c2791p1 [Helicosporidium sp. ATCC 50920]
MFRLLHVALVFTALATFGALRQLWNIQHLQIGAVYGTPNQELSLLSKRWRAERNVWIALFSCVQWLCLAAFYYEASRRITAEMQVEAFARLAPSNTSTDVRRAHVGDVTSGTSLPREADSDSDESEGSRPMARETKKDI